MKRSDFETSYRLEERVILPKRRRHKTPRLLMGDAYTIGSFNFESEEAKEKSVYYMTFRRRLSDINSTIYKKGDDRILFAGIQGINDMLFYEPFTHEEIDETKEFLKYAKVTMKGFKNYPFPEEIWRDIVDNFNGRPPMIIEGLPEGSVCYPNEPVLQITCQHKNAGYLAAWFESKLLHAWGTTERLTQDEHFKLRVKERLLKVDPDMAEEMQEFLASIIITDFGDRAAFCQSESEILGMVNLYSFGGTDTFSGAYQAWKNCDDKEKAIGLFSSVHALAHRNVQSYIKEQDCYNTLYESLENDEIGSYVGDCYDFKNALHNYLLPLALRSRFENNGKVVVARPDSSKEGYTTKDQVLEVCDLACKAHLNEVIETKSGKWKTGTLLKFLDGDGKTFEEILDIIDTLIDRGYAFYTWGLFGVGGNLRNNLKRDNLSAKYALASVGKNNRPVVKFSESIGKGTLCGPFALLRCSESLKNKKTIVFHTENVLENAYVEYFNGLRKNKPFGEGQDDDFLAIKARIRRQMNGVMPLTLETEENHNYPASDAIMKKKQELLIEYTPNK